ncbi:MAG: 3-dehydroquinate synthase II [Candidatus Methanogaster sp.]|uniref:3-dehydroquinate synthase II n=1 Tax=Candidatus Methanogaster sp. TaxID=3386292 RepID=A0AC61KY61_9EURY|nr:MAG: 3-dehydroquinate synthase II [ANME-2 cluster archaeon]
MSTKTTWIKADTGNWDAQKQRITTSLESGVECVLASVGRVGKVRELGEILVASPVAEEVMPDIVMVGIKGEGDGTQPLPTDLTGSMDIITAEKLVSEGQTVAGYVVIRDKKYEQFAVELGKVCDYLIAIGTDWKVIPLENMIAGLFEEDVLIIAGVRDADEAKLAIETLEHGADGVLIDTDDPSEIKRIVGVVERSGIPAVPLQVARVTVVEPRGMGDRVCVDTCSLMSVGEGMLVGSQSNGLFLIQSEAEDSPYVASRPFRVNAGAVHAYAKVGEKTQYLSELSAGDGVVIVNARGEQRDGIVGRVKIEKRPLTLVKAEVDGNMITTILQNAETIKLVGVDGRPISIANLKVGDEVLVHFEDSARHFGMKIDETIIEK